MRALSLLSVLVVSFLGCGGKTRPPIANSATANINALPWEAALTKGASFELGAEFPPEDGEVVAPLTVTVADVTVDGSKRTYHLTWSDPSGPASITVDGGAVVIGEATAAEMKEPLGEAGSDEFCYGQDFSNPDGCDDVCDADLCVSSHGIVAVSGLYAPNYLPYRAHE